MNKIQHLPNAPIQEAVIDIRANLARKIEKNDLPGIKERFKSEFPVFKEIITFGGKLAFNGNAKTPIVEDTNSALLGYRLDSQDGKHILQVRNNGFTFSRLCPYTNWNDVKSQALNYWNWFKSFREITNISRLAVRYINRIVLPFPVNDLSEYLTAPPSLPEGVSQSLENFFTKVTVAYPDKDASANIVQAFEKADEKQGVNIILDIDVYSSREDFNEADVWPFLEDLRSIKNQIFFAGIREKTMEIFK
jgi:uncharacterized protein (TIGR04255 family)